MNEQLCQVCDGPVERLLDLGLQPISTRYVAVGGELEYRHPLVLGQCSRCALLQLLDPVPAPERRRDLGSLKFNEPESHLDDLAQRISKLPGLTARSPIAGFSYKDDSLLRRLRDLGYERTRGLEIDPSSLTDPDVDEHACEFDVVIARHVVEHADSLRQLLAKLRSILRPGGHLVVEVPDFTTCVRVRDYSFIWEEHLVYFTPETFAHSVDRLGMSVVQQFIYPQPLENSIVGILSPLGRRPELDSPRTLDLSAVGFTRDFLRRHRQVRDRLADCQQRFGAIAGFGAGHLMAKYINFFQLAPAIEFVIDDDPRKQGLRMPGSQLPIVTSDQLHRRPLGLVLLGLSPESEDRVLRKLGESLSSRVTFASIFEASPRSLTKVLEAG